MLIKLLILSAALFSIGLTITIIKNNAVMILIGIELMLNAVNINFIAFAKNDPSVQGQVFTLFVLMIAAAEAAVGLAIVLKLYSDFKTADVNEAKTLQG